MNKIVSKDNALYKKIKKLGSKKYREAFGEYIVEGPNLISEVIKRNKSLNSVVIREEDISKKEVSSLVNFLKEKKIYSNLQISTIKSDLFKDLSDTVNSQGILGIVEKINLTKDEFIKKIEPTENLLIMDRIQDPANVGAMIRTALGAGYGGIVALKGTADIYSQKVVRACVGSLFDIPIYFAESEQEVFDIVKKTKKKLVTTGFNTDKMYFQVDLSKDIALVLGNEGNGISQSFFENSDMIVKIPMRNELESLNVSVASGILMYETFRRDKI